MIVSERMVDVPAELTEPQLCPYPYFSKNGDFLDWALACQAANKQANQQLKSIRELSK